MRGEIYKQEQTSLSMFRQSFYGPRWMRTHILRVPWVQIRQQFLVLRKTYARPNYQSRDSGRLSNQIQFTQHSCKEVFWSKKSGMKMRLTNAARPSGANNTNNALHKNTRHQYGSQQSHHTLHEDE